VDHVPLDLDPTTVAVAMVASFVLALVSAVAGFGGGVALLPVFVALFGLRVAVPVLTLTQLVSNGSRVALNRHGVDAPLVGWFALGAVPCAVGAGLAFAAAPLGFLERLLGVLLLAIVVWRRLRPRPPRLSSHAFVAVGAASGLGSALVGSVGPLTAPFFLARGLVKEAYIGTEACSAVVMHAAKLVAYGVGALLSMRVLVLGLLLAPTTMLGAWAGRHVVRRMSERAFVLVVEVGLVVSGLLLLAGV
jgi:uncharacterized membrane protein YfcA